MEYFRSLFGRSLAGRTLDGRRLDGSASVPKSGGKPGIGVDSGGSPGVPLDFSDEANSQMIAILADDPF